MSILLDKKSYLEKSLNERQRDKAGGNEVRTASRRSMLDILPGLVQTCAQAKKKGFFWGNMG